MHRWFDLQIGAPENGYFVRQELVSRTGNFADQLPDFVDQLVNLILGYVTADHPVLGAVFNQRYQFPMAALDEYSPRCVERLLAKRDDDQYMNLKGFIGECIAHWIAETFEQQIAITPPRPFSFEPAFDLVAVGERADQLETLCIQAKTTAGYASDEVRNAIEKYDRMHKGEYDFELSNVLSMLVSIPPLRDRLAGFNWRKPLLDVETRRYAISVTFDGNSPDGPRSQWPNAWAKSVPGNTSRRLLIVVPVSDCDALVEEVARIIRAKTA